MADLDIRQEGFPAPSKHATGIVNSKQTDITSINFSDKIILTISQEGRLAQWVRDCFSQYPNFFSLSLFSLPQVIPH